MKKRFLYKTHTTDANDFSKGTILFDRTKKTVTIGGDEMYPEFTLYAEGEYRMNGTLAEKTELDHEKYEEFLSNADIDTSAMDCVKVVYETGEYNGVIKLGQSFNNVADNLIQFISNEGGYSDASVIKFSYIPNNYIEFKDGTFSFENEEGTSIPMSSSDCLGYVYSVDTEATINDLINMGYSPFDDSEYFTIEYNADESAPDDSRWSIYPHSGGNTMYMESLSELHLEFALDTSTMTTSGSNQFKLYVHAGDNAEDGSVNVDMYDAEGSSYGEPVEVPASLISEMYSKNIIDASITINYNEEGDMTSNTLEVYSYSIYQSTSSDVSTNDKLNMMTGIDINLASYYMETGDLTIHKNPVTSRGGRVPAPTAHNQVLTSDGWQANDNDWDEYEF